MKWSQWSARDAARVGGSVRVLPAWPPGEHHLASATPPHLRSLVAAYAETAGLPAQRVGDLVLAMHEAASNTIRHGSGKGTVRIWDDAEGVICEIRDAATSPTRWPAASAPGTPATGGWGLWLANQLCELVQIRSLPEGTVVRLHEHRA